MAKDEKSILQSQGYAKALAFARGLRAPGQPLEFPNYTAYVHLVAEQVDIDLENFDADMGDFQELPEAFELAYLTVRLERLTARIKAEHGVDVSTL